MALPVEAKKAAVELTKKETEERVVKAVISAVALVVFVGRHAWHFDVEPTDLGLLALAVIPWMAAVLESAKMPGGWEFKFREVEAKAEDASKKADKNSERLNQLYLLMMSDHLFHTLETVVAKKPGEVEVNDPLRWDLRYLRGIGFITVPNVGAIPAGHTDLSEWKVEATDLGREFVERRRALDNSTH